MRPWPAGPAWKMFSQNACSTGFSVANVASSAPTMMLSFPSSASTGVRASGASTNSTPAEASDSRIFVVVAGSLVDVSTTTSPLRAALAMPSLPLTISSTCGAPVTQRNTMSDARATSALVAASFAPAAMRSSSGFLLRCARTVNGKPLVTRFFAIPWPMRPSPMKPMRGLALVAAFMCILRRKWNGPTRTRRPIGQAT